MMKRIICAVLALVLCCSLAISVSAEGKDTTFVIDELGYLTDDGIAALKRLLRCTVSVKRKKESSSCASPLKSQSRFLPV